MTQQHNAMVFDAETVELPDGNETTKVQIQYTIFMGRPKTLSWTNA